MRNVQTALLLVPIAVFSAATAGAELQLDGAEFHVNTYATGQQIVSSVSESTDGKFVVVWQSSDQDGDGEGIFGQRFDADAVALGPEFPVNLLTAQNQESPSVALAPSGQFVVVWTSWGPGIPEDVFARGFDASGAALGPDFRVNTTTSGTQYTWGLNQSHQVNALAGGTFVATWTDQSGVDGDGWGVLAQRFDATGALDGSEFVVSSDSALNQYYPAVAAAADGRFAVAWEGAGGGGPYYTGHFRRFDASGSPLAPQSDSVPDAVSEGLDVAMDSSGRFALVSESTDAPGSVAVRNVVARRFDAAGSAVGSELLIDNVSGAKQEAPVVAMSDDGSFAVAWHDGGDIFVREVGADGSLVGTSLLVSSDGSFFGEETISSDGAGNYVVAWTKNNEPDGAATSEGIYARRICSSFGGFLGCQSCQTDPGGGGTIIKANIKLKKIARDPLPGDDVIKLQLDFTLPEGSAFATDVDPTARPLRLTIHSAGGALLLDQRLATSAFGGRGSAGWRGSGSTRWSFVDKTDSPAAGIFKASIEDRGSSVPRGVRVKLKGKNGDYPITTSDLPIVANLVVGNGVLGQCGRTSFDAESCRVNGAETGVTCRQ